MANTAFELAAIRSLVKCFHLRLAHLTSLNPIVHPRHPLLAAAKDHLALAVQALDDLIADYPKED